MCKSDISQTHSHAHWKPQTPLLLKFLNILLFYDGSFQNISVESQNFTELFFHYSSASQSIQMCCFFTFCLFPPKHHCPFPCQLLLRLFRCTSMEAAEVCHRWRCRRREEFCVWRDAQRKKRVGCRDVYKEELTVLRVHSSLRHTYSDFTTDGEEQTGKEDLSNHLIKQNLQDWLLNSSHSLHIIFYDFWIFGIICTKICADSR